MYIYTVFHIEVHLGLGFFFPAWMVSFIKQTFVCSKILKFL